MQTSSSDLNSSQLQVELRTLASGHGHGHGYVLGHCHVLSCVFRPAAIGGQRLPVPGPVTAVIIRVTLCAAPPCSGYAAKQLHFQLEVPRALVSLNHRQRGLALARAPGPGSWIRNADSDAAGAAAGGRREGGEPEG
jgi:hypothetical protein